jgi:hypothetical protein
VIRKDSLPLPRYESTSVSVTTTPLSASNFCVVHFAFLVGSG